MLYLEMGLSWIAELLVLLPFILARGTAGNTALCLGAGTALWILEWYVARPLPEGEETTVFEWYHSANGKTFGHSYKARAAQTYSKSDADVFLYIPGIWVLFAQTAVFLRFSADLLEDTLRTGMSGAFWCPPVFLGTILIARFWQKKRERRASSGNVVRPGGAAAAVSGTAAVVLPAVAILTVRSRAAEAGPQEFAVIAAAFPDGRTGAGKWILIFLLMAGLLLSAAVSYLGLQRIISALIPRRMRRRFSGLWPVCILIPLILAAGFRNWTALIGWYTAYSVFILAPVTGIFVLFGLLFRLRDGR